MNKKELVQRRKNQDNFGLNGQERYRFQSNHHFLRSQHQSMKLLQGPLLNKINELVFQIS